MSDFRNYFESRSRKCTNKILIRKKEKQQFLGFYVAEYVFEKNWHLSNKRLMKNNARINNG